MPIMYQNGAGRSKGVPSCTLWTLDRTNHYKADWRCDGVVMVL